MAGVQCLSPCLKSWCLDKIKVGLVDCGIVVSLRLLLIREVRFCFSLKMLVDMDY